MLRPTLPLKLVSTEIPEARDLLAIASSLQGTANSLLLLPGRPGEILLQLKNTSTTPLRWTLVIQGDFPKEWCLWNQEWTQEILPNEEFREIIPFQVPTDFFEQQHALSQDQQHLQLKYQSQICLYIGETDNRQLVGYQPFDLCIQPIRSYLDFLPEIYRTSDFMGRFLSIFERAFDPTVQTVDTLWAYLDPLTAPKTLLPFLAKWVAWEMNPQWGLKQQRRLIRHAVELYRWRGTRRGLRLYLHLYTQLPLDSDRPESEKHISIIEEVSAGFQLGQVNLNQGAMLGSGRPYHFTVTLRPDTAEQAAKINETLVRNIIEQEKPAFCTYDLQILSA
jgi:phage tail-like protein